MSVPELTGYELERQICSTMSRVITLWFGKVDYDAQRWKQIQVTLVGARIVTATVEITEMIPPFKSCFLGEIQRGNRKTTQLTLSFDPGEIVFEGDKVSFAEYEREIRVARST